MYVVLPTGLSVDMSIKLSFFLLYHINYLTYSDNFFLGPAFTLDFTGGPAAPVVDSLLSYFFPSILCDILFQIKPKYGIVSFPAYSSWMNIAR